MSSKHRKIRDEADAQECFQALAASGECLADWARNNGISRASLVWWKNCLGIAIEGPNLLSPPRVDHVERDAEASMSEIAAARQQIEQLRASIGDRPDRNTVHRVVPEMGELLTHYDRIIMAQLRALSQLVAEWAEQAPPLRRTRP